jgi:hypothetical protein
MDVVDPRASRVAWNESAFREVNERMRELAAELDRAAEFLCECANTECTQHLRVPVAEYESARAHARRFVVVPGHEDGDFERVVERGDAWLVVEKIGEAGEIAAEHDPRRTSET